MLRIVLFTSVLLGAAGAYCYVFERDALANFLDGTPLELPATTTEVYKWRDAKGVWHISDQRPVEDVKSETLRYRSDDNILPMAPIED
jgi:hypothetical protein